MIARVGVPAAVTAVTLAAITLGCGGPEPGTDAGPPPGEPPAGSITVNEMPNAMNGSAPFTNASGELESFTLVLPVSGFTFDLRLEGGDAFPDTDTLRVWCNASFGGGGAAGGRDPGEDLSDLFEPEPPLRFHWRVPSELALAATYPGGVVTCGATVDDTEGRTSPEAVLAFGTTPLTPDLDPFDVEDLWILDFSRDFFTVTPDLQPDGTYTALSVDGANGIPDYEEEMVVIGMRGGESAPGAATLVVGGEVGVNAVVGRRLRVALLERVRGYFHRAPDGTGSEDAVGVTFILDDDPAAPDPATFSALGSFSVIGIGGEGTVEDRMVPVFGRAQLDPRNAVRNDNSPFGLGVFTTTAIKAVLGIPFAGTLLQPLVPSLGGVAIGDHPADPVFLAEDWDPTAPGVTPEVKARAELFFTVTGLLIKAFAALTAHEIGHSLGLVVDGAPPFGLFGGETMAEFALPLTTSGHLDVGGLNLMAAGGGGAGLGDATSLLDEPFFSPMILAYLRGRLVVLPPQ